MVAKRKYVFICRKCGRPHFSEEYDESRFCRNCGKFLSPQNISSRLTNEKNWEKEEILRWSKIHDDSYTWWMQQEKELGEKIRTRKELTKKDLVKVVEWKFDTLPRRKKRILSLITKNEDKKIRRISNLSLASKQMNHA